MNTEVDFDGEAGPVQDGLKSEEKTWGMLSHLSGLCGYIIPLGNILGPLIIWMVKKDESKYVADHAKEALNFQISYTIYMIVSIILIFVLIGIFLVAALAIAGLVFMIIAAIKANDGRSYKYPLTIRFVK